MSGLKHELNGKHTFNSCNQQVLTHSFLLHPLTCLLNPMKEAVCCLWTRPQPQIYSGWEFVDVRAAGRCCLHSKVTPLWTEMPLCRLTERIHLPLISPYSHKHGARSRSSCLPACPAPPPYPRAPLPSPFNGTGQRWRGKVDSSSCTDFDDCACEFPVRLLWSVNNTCLPSHHTTDSHPK